MKMTRINIAIAFLLASCFAVTSGVFIERRCDWDTMRNCTKAMNEMMGVEDTDIMCPPMQAAKRCLEGTKSACGEEDSGILNAIDGYLGGLVPYIEKCPDNGISASNFFQGSNSDDTTQDHNDHDNYNTSPEPWGEPVNTNHETSPEPWGEPHNECTVEAYTECANIMQDFGSDMNKICSMYEEAKSCFDGFYHNCEDGYVKESVEAYMPSIRTTLINYCGHDKYDTTSEPWGEPNNNHETSPEPWGEPTSECSWDGYTKCSDMMDATNGESDMKKICSIYENAKSCFDGFLNGCHQSDIVQSARNSLQSIANTLRTYCHKDDHQTSPEPWGEPNGDECTWERFGVCGTPFKRMETMKDPYEICRVWWTGKGCFGSMLRSCKDNAIIGSINATWVEVERHMGYCNNYVRCTMDARRGCMDKIKQAWSVEDKCRNVEPARQCLQTLTNECHDGYEMDQIRRVAMPWVNKMKNDCMYGNMNGEGSMTGDGQAWENSRWSSGESVHMTKTMTSLYLAVSVAMVVMMSAYRL